jgi:hypothetical protein
MASKFAKFCEQREQTGENRKEWIENVVIPALQNTVNNDNNIVILSKDTIITKSTNYWKCAEVIPIEEKKQELMPVGKCGVLFNKPTCLVYQSTDNTQSSGSAIVATPVAFVSIVDSFYNSYYTEYSYHSIKKPYLIVPLAIFQSEQLSSFERAIFEQCGAQWIASGEPFKLDYQPDNCALMFTYSIQSIIFSICTEHNKSKIDLFTKMIIYIYYSAKSYFSKEDRAFKVIEPLFTNLNAIDMLNRAVIVFLFSEKKPAINNILYMMEISLKRIFRRTKSRSTDFMKDPTLIAGILGITTILPIFRRHFDDLPTKSLDELCASISKEINEVMFNYAKKFKLVLETKNNLESSNKAIICSLFELGKLCFSKEQFDNFYNFCSDLKKFYVPAPFSKWGLIKSSLAPFKILNSGFYHHNTYTIPVLFMKSKEKKSHSIIARDYTTWSAIGLKDAGTYTFKCKSIGNSEYGEGNTVGEHHVAILRVTTGPDILPTQFSKIKREGLASTGMHYSLVRKLWRYRRSEWTLDLDEEFVLIIKNNYFVIRQKNRIWFEGNLREYVTFSFKFLSLQLIFERDNVTTTDDSTGIALIDKLSQEKLNT